MEFYKDSTQLRNWIKSRDELTKISKLKVETFLRRVNKINESIQSSFTSQQQQHPTPSTSNTLSELQPPQPLPPQVPHLIKLKKFHMLTPENEKSLIIYQTSFLLKLINSNIKSRSLKTHALTYFRRFYLKKSVIDYDINMLLCASIFLGSKVAQLDINKEKMKDLCPYLKEIDPHLLKLIDYEYFLCFILSYDFYVFCPYKAMLGLLFKLNQKNYFNNDKDKNIFENECEELIDISFLTDLVFLYSYAFIALSVILMVVKKRGRDIDEVIRLLEIERMVDVKLFKEGIMKDIECCINGYVPILDSESRKNLAKVENFRKTNPMYVKKLEEERRNLEKKMDGFSKAFDNVSGDVPQHLRQKEYVVKNNLLANYNANGIANNQFLNMKRERTLSGDNNIDINNGNVNMDIEMKNAMN